MVREDIVAGLKNAVEKGESLETAKQSFISAGYSREEVEEASNLVQSGSALIIRRGENFPPLKIQTQQQTQQLETPKENMPIKNKPKGNFKIILLVIVLLFLVGILILTIVFKEKIINFLS